MNRIFKVACLLVLVFSFGFNTEAQNKEKSKIKLDIGGALRFNYNFSEWNKKHKKTGGEFNYDVFILNVKASYGKLSLVSDYRFYNREFGGRMFKYGYIAYTIDDANQIQMGLTSVPFGATTESFHNFFCNIDYYLGLNTDFDMGVKFSHVGQNLNYDLAFFKSSENFGAGNNKTRLGARYSYDIAGDYDEINSINARAIYKLGDKSKHFIGASVMGGQLYNIKTEDIANRYALSAHYELKTERYHLIAQYTNYNFRDDETIKMIAFGSDYNVAPKGNLYTLAMSYDIPVDFGMISSLRFYNDFGYLDKKNEAFNDSFQNVTGCMITAGPIYSYIDCVMAKNQAWFGSDWNDAFTTGKSNADWHCRFNINVGYYF